MPDDRLPETADVRLDLVAQVERTACCRGCDSPAPVECAETGRPAAASLHIDGPTDLRLALSAVSLAPECGRHHKACKGAAVASWELTQRPSGLRGKSSGRSPGIRRLDTSFVIETAPTAPSSLA